MQTMAQMDRFRGHLYNWYDTRDLHPLDPKYVSSVDSGNMAGHLLALRNGCRELDRASSIDGRLLEGLRDTIHLLEEALEKYHRHPPDADRDTQATQKAIDELLLLSRNAPTDAHGWAERFAELSERAQTVADIAQTLAQERGDADPDVRAWAEAVQACVESHFAMRRS